jgi:hypothetical protein
MIPESTGFATVDSPRHRGVSGLKAIEAANELVPTIDLANRLCGGQMRCIGERWTARCPLPDHEDRTPSFVVYPGDGGWWCFGCDRGGDAVNLAALAWEHERQDDAAAYLLLTFGHEVPQRPSSWTTKQKRQAPIRDVIEDARVEVLMRRLWRWVFAPILADIEDADERARVGHELWAKVRPLAVKLIEERRTA